MPIVLNGTTGITTPTYNGSTTAEYLVPVTGFKNRIINGNMTIDQRRNGVAFSGTGTVVEFFADRFFSVLNVSGLTSTLGQSTVAPPGFTNSIIYTATTGASAGSTDRAQITQRIEGFNIADLAWGTANAKPVTLSFWVRSSRTGQFGGSLQNNAGNRSYPFTYTINSANTWEYETITVPGDTTGTWLTDNSSGIGLTFDIGMGSSLLTGTANAWAAGDFRGVTGDTSIVSTTGANFYLTGVQLEVGSTATSFDYRPYGTELQLCQRYFYQTNRYLGLTQASDTLYGPAIAFPVTMRTTPTLNTGATFTARTGSNGVPLISSGVTGIVATNDAVAVYNSSSNWNTNTWVSFNGGFTAEL